MQHKGYLFYSLWYIAKPVRETQKSVHRYKLILKNYLLLQDEETTELTKKKSKVQSHITLDPSQPIGSHLHLQCSPWPSSRIENTWYSGSTPGNLVQRCHLCSISWSSVTHSWGLCSYTFHHHASWNSAIGFKKCE